MCYVPCSLATSVFIESGHKTVDKRAVLGFVQLVVLVCDVSVLVGHLDVKVVAPRDGRTIYLSNGTDDRHR